MKSLFTIVIVTTTFLLCTVAVTIAAPAAKSGIDYEGNLALVPPADPAVSNAPVLLEYPSKPTMTLTEDGDTVIITVKTDKYTDTWTWQSSKDLTTPSKIIGMRDGKLIMELTEVDVAPQGD